MACRGLFIQGENGTGYAEREGKFPTVLSAVEVLFAGLNGKSNFNSKKKFKQFPCFFAKFFWN